MPAARRMVPRAQRKENAVNRLNAVWLLVCATACSESAGPPAQPALTDPAGLAARLAPINHAANVPPLQSLGAVSVPLYLSNLDIFSIMITDFGHRHVWDSNSGLYVRSDSVDGPADAARVVLYAIDSRSDLPAIPLVEIGTVDLYPYNAPAQPSTMRYVVSGTGPNAVVYADFNVVPHYQVQCWCATVAGWVSDGVTRLDFSAPYQVFPFSGGLFPANVTVSPQSFHFLQVGGLPGLGDSTVGATARFAFNGDSLESQGSLVFHTTGPATGSFTILINGRSFATGAYQAGALSFTGADGRALTPAEQAALVELATLPLGLALNVEFPTLTTFYCGC